MGRRFAELAFTPLVKEQQRQHNSRTMYARVEQSPDIGDSLGKDEQEFVRERDGFYMASVSETGWPYVQYRGGEKGFLRVLDEHTLGFADLRGNKQYISVGNLEHDDRVTLFLMDYRTQSRLKILGRSRVYEGDAEARELIEKLRVPEEKTPAERAILIQVEAFDWNCQQHITPRYTQQEMAEMLIPMRQRMEALEAENKQLREAAPDQSLRGGASQAGRLHPGRKIGNSGPACRLQSGCLFAMIQRCVQGKSLDCHKHHGFWTYSSELAKGTKRRCPCGQHFWVPCKAGLAKTVGDEERMARKNSARIKPEGARGCHQACVCTA